MQVLSQVAIALLGVTAIFLSQSANAARAIHEVRAPAGSKIVGLKPRPIIVDDPIPDSRRTQYEPEEG